MKTAEELSQEVEFLLTRAMQGGLCYFGQDRFTGVSSNAMVFYAFGGEYPSSDKFPYDPSDLKACVLTRKMAPNHIKPKMDDLLIKYRDAVATRYPVVKDWELFND